MKLPIQIARRARTSLLNSREERAERAGRLPHPVDGSQVLWSLQQTPIFRSLSEEECDGLLKSLQKTELDRGEEVRLSLRDGIRIVVKGGIKVIRYAPDGRALISMIVDAGGMFGRLTETTECLDVQPMEATTLLLVSRSQLHELLQKNPNLTLAIVQELEERSRRMERRVASLIFKSVEARTVEALLEFAQHYGEPCAHGMAVDIRITQQDLAELIGSSREAVNRVLSALKKKAYLRREGPYLCISNQERLERLARAQLHEGAGEGPFP